MHDKYLAYDGAKLRIEWFYSVNGHSESREYFEELPIDRKKKVAHLFILLGDHGKIQSAEKFLHEGDQIYVFKTKVDRLFCFFDDDAKVIITNGYEKKANKMPPGEKERAIRTRSDYITRCRENNYYA